MKVYLRTFGCRANQYDTEAVRALVTAGGHDVVESSAEADVAVFNSCAVTAGAEAELRKVVRHAARETPALRSIVMGCASALDANRPPSMQIRELASVTHVIAGADLPAISAALGVVPDGSTPRTSAQAGTRALLRIQDGCDQHCTFCATTMARGANRSRPMDELIREATVLADGHAEIVITGIHIGTYGEDTGSSLGALMTALVRSVPGVRFRLSSIEATEIDDALVDLLAGAASHSGWRGEAHSAPHIAPHIHAPLQSGSDALLRTMGRSWYTSGTYTAAIDRIAGRVPTLGLGADLIAGFPGESDADHTATCALVERLPFTYLHVFPYSARPGTAAVRLREQVPAGVAQRRAAELRTIGDRKAAAYRASRSGGVADVVVLGGRGDREGLTGDYLAVTPADQSLPRGTRFMARLVLEQDRLLAHPVNR